MVCCGGNGCVIDNELVENIPLDKDGCIKIIHQGRKNLVMDGVWH